MSQNRSSAVMQQRAEPHDSLDFFPTPPWASRALVAHVLTGNGWGAHSFIDMTALDPCCGALHMVRPLRETFGAVHASDVHDYSWHDYAQRAAGSGREARQEDFLLAGKLGCDPDFIVFNPPFRLGLEFILKARGQARQAVCALVRVAFLEGEARHRLLFSRHRPLLVAQFVERVPMFKGLCRDPEVPYWCVKDKKWKRPSTATAYCWIVWPARDFTATDIRTRMIWIPPCRKQLTREGDYDPPTLPPAGEAGGDAEIGEGLI
jgi:hypothetical protein